MVRIGKKTAVALLALPNSGAARYYAVVVPPLLLLTVIILPMAWNHPVKRWIAAAISLTFLLTAAVADRAIIRNLRGDPGRAVATLARVAPGGAIVSVDYSRSSAILIAAARSQRERHRAGALPASIGTVTVPASIIQLACPP